MDAPLDRSQSQNLCVRMGASHPSRARVLLPWTVVERVECMKRKWGMQAPLAVVRARVRRFWPLRVHASSKFLTIFYYEFKCDFRLYSCPM